MGYIFSPACPRECHFPAFRMAEKAAANATAGDSSSLTYSELCQSLPVDLLRPCLLRQMEVVYDILASYYVMERWHKDCIQQQKQQKQEQAGEGVTHSCSLPAPPLMILPRHYQYCGHLPFLMFFYAA